MLSSVNEQKTEEETCGDNIEIKPRPDMGSMAAEASMFMDHGGREETTEVGTVIELRGVEECMNVTNAKIRNDVKNPTKRQAGTLWHCPGGAGDVINGAESERGCVTLCGTIARIVVCFDVKSLQIKRLVTRARSGRLG